MYNIIIFGPPGSGKGTQSAKLAEKYKLTHISTGDIFRAEINPDMESYVYEKMPSRINTMSGFP